MCLQLHVCVAGPWILDTKDVTKMLHDKDNADLHKPTILDMYIVHYKKTTNGEMHEKM